MKLRDVDNDTTDEQTASRKRTGARPRILLWFSGPPNVLRHKPRVRERSTTVTGSLWLSSG